MNHNKILPMILLGHQLYISMSVGVKREKRWLLRGKCLPVEGGGGPQTVRGEGGTIYVNLWEGS